MSSDLLGRLLVASAALALAACGGGGGSGTASTPTPPPSPPPPATQTCWDGSVIPATDTCPAPPPPPPEKKTCPDGSIIPETVTCPPPPIFSGVTAGLDFKALGFERKGSLAELARVDFAIRYDAATQSYLFDVPAETNPVTVSLSELAHPLTYSGTDPNTHGYDLSDTIGQRKYLDIFNGTSINPELSLTYTSFGFIRQSTCGGDYYSYYCNLDYHDLFAFGSPTPDSGVPLTGTATYDALVYGEFDDHAVFARYIRGSTTLQFDFGAGTLAGHFDPVLVSTTSYPPISLGAYNFVNTVFGVGSTSFSGKLSHVGTDSLGSFDGLFTGPVAQELMARWNAPYQDPSTQQWYNMYGVWVGKRQ